MKTRSIIATGILAALLFSCTGLSYLPENKTIDTNQYGSYIQIKIKDSGKAKGELLAADEKDLFVLNKDTMQQKILKIPFDKVERFKLRYAKPKHYGWTIPVSAVATIAHGWYAGLTLPVNLVTTTSVTVGGEKAFTYNKKTMPLNKIQMFARFPQGIPDNVDLARIKAKY